MDNFRVQKLHLNFVELSASLDGGLEALLVVLLRALETVMILEFILCWNCCN